MKYLIPLFFCFASIVQASLKDYKYTVLTESFPPYNFLEKSEVAGASTEIVYALFDRLKLPKPDIKMSGWSEVYEETINHRGDDIVILYSTMRIPQRERMFKWVGPIAPFTFNLIGIPENGKKEINELDDAKRYMTAVIKDDFAELFLLKSGFRLKKNLHRIEFEHEKGIELLYQNKVDFVALAYLSASYIAKKTGRDPTKLKVYWQKDGFPYSGLFMAFSRNTPDEVIDAFSGALSQLKNSGEYIKILGKYFQ